MLPEPIAMPMSREQILEPPVQLGRLREHGSLHRLRYRGGEVGWLVTGHRMARMVLTDGRFSLRFDRPFPVEDPRKHAAIQETLHREGIGVGNLLSMDPPAHSRIRKLLAGHFSIEQVNGLRSRIEGVVSRQLDLIESVGPPADLVETFAKPIVLSTHCALLGVPEGDGPIFERLAATSIDHEASADDVIAAMQDFRLYLEQMIAFKRAHPGEDLMSQIVETDELSSDEVAGVLELIFAAGVDTTASMLSLGPLALLCHRDQFESLREAPGSIDGAVDELMRYLTIFQVGAITRTALEDVELDEITIRAGELVTVSLAAANRDPNRFDEPDTLNVQRAARGHLGFGHGVHTCLGQHLARLEMQVALRLLIARFPNLQLAVDVNQIQLSGEEDLIYAVDALPVTW